MYTIKVNFEEKDHESKEIQVEEGLSILEGLILNKIDLNHNCGAVCACTTCHIYVENGNDHIEEMSDKEEDYVDRAANPRLESRLACQCFLDKGKGTIEITIPDQSDIIGHEH